VLTGLKFIIIQKLLQKNKGQQDFKGFGHRKSQTKTGGLLPDVSQVKKQASKNSNQALSPPMQSK
jgi:hypothetical protein